jgi:hypothetical protein
MMRRVLAVVLFAVSAIEVVCVGVLGVSLFGALSTNLPLIGIVGGMVLCLAFAGAVSIGAARLWRSSGAG